MSKSEAGGSWDTWWGRDRPNLLLLSQRNSPDQLGTSIQVAVKFLGIGGFMVIYWAERVKIYQQQSTGFHFTQLIWLQWDNVRVCYKGFVSWRRTSTSSDGLRAYWVFVLCQDTVNHQCSPFLFSTEALYSKTHHPQERDGGPGPWGLSLSYALEFQFVLFNKWVYFVRGRDVANLNPRWLRRNIDSKKFFICKIWNKDS